MIIYSTNVPPSLRNGRELAGAGSSGSIRLSSSSTTGGSDYIKLYSSTLQVVKSDIAIDGAFSATSIAENGVLLSAKYITPAGVDAKINAIINAAPTTLDTLSELATALGNDPNFATTITNMIGTKAPLASPNFSGIPKVDGNAIFHAGNANLPTVDWQVKNIYCNNWAYANGFTTKDGQYPQIDFHNTTTNKHRLLFNGGDTNQLSWRYNGVDDVVLYGGHNSNKPTVQWSASDLSLGNSTTHGIYMNNGTSVHNIVSRNDGFLLFGRNGIRNDFYIDANGDFNIAGITTSENNFISKVRHTASFIGNWQHSGYWGIGEDEASGSYWVKLQGWYNVWNNNPVNLNVTGEVKVGGARVASSNQNGSGFTAAGWQIGDYSNLNNLDVRSRLQVYEFVQNKINISNGNLIVTDSAKVDSVWFWKDGGVTGTGQHVRYSFAEQHPFNVGDIIRCQYKGKSYIVTVGYIDNTRLFFDAYNSYNNAGVSDSAAGDLLIRWDSNDANRKGLLYLNSSDTNAPNFQVVHGGAVKGCFGNCAGLNWQGAPLPANSWGTWIDNGWFNGSVNANSGNIGGFSIDSYQLHTGTNSAGLTPKIRLSNSNVTVNDGFVYTGSRVLEGLSLTWHRDFNAGHLVFGQLAANGNTLKDGFKGIQMMDWRGYEYFALGANVNVENTDSHYCRIAGWNFDTNTIWKGAKYGNAGNGLEIRSEGDWSRVLAKRDDNSYTMLYNDGFNNTFGISSRIGGSTVFELGSSNNIAGWTFDSYHLYSGYMSLNANGSIEHTGGKWRFNNNGSGVLAGGNINWDDAGNATFNGTINATAGNFTGTVNASGGTIGGFTINSSNLSTSTSNFLISLDGVNGLIKYEGIGSTRNSKVYIGNYEDPLTNFRSSFKAVSAANTSGSNNTAAAVFVADHFEKIAVRAEGNIIANGITCGYKTYYHKFLSFATYTMSLEAGSTLIVENASGTDNCTINLPSTNNIITRLGLNSTEDASIEFTIIGKYDTPRRFLFGYNNYNYKVKNNDGGDLGDLWMSGGDVLNIRVFRLSGSWFAQLVNRMS